MEEPVQVWKSHSRLYGRIRKSLYFGNSKKPLKNSLPLTELTVNLIQSIAKGQGLGNLDVDYASHILKQACFPPAMPAPTLIIAMIYLDRLKGFKSDYLHQTSPSELFLVSLLIASKWLYDSGEDEIVYNDEWAEFGNLDLEDLNRLERDFLGAIDWSCYVDPDSFERQLAKFEALVALREYLKRTSARQQHHQPGPGGPPNLGMTYTELLSLTTYLRTMGSTKGEGDHHPKHYWSELIDFAESICICVLAYCAAVLIILSSVSIGVFALQLALHQHHRSALDLNSSTSSSSNQADNFSLPSLHQFGYTTITTAQFDHPSSSVRPLLHLQTAYISASTKRRNLTGQKDPAAGLLAGYNQLLLRQKQQANKILMCS